MLNRPKKRKVAVKAKQVVLRRDDIGFSFSEFDLQWRFCEFGREEALILRVNLGFDGEFNEMEEMGFENNERE